MVKWGTLGHTAVDVNLIAYGRDDLTHSLKGNHENVEVRPSGLLSACFPRADG